MRHSIALLAGITLLGACRGEQIPTGTDAHIQPAAASYASSTAGNAEIAELIRVTTPFQDFETARTAGWATQITPCMSTPEGGMGFHYGNTALIDGTARVREPELLLYEPDRNGQKHLVAVEYIIPYTFHSRSSSPPVLFGQQFKQVDAFQLWGLHVWVWKQNSRGLFAPWNPQVSCGLAGTISAMAH